MSVFFRLLPLPSLLFLLNCTAQHAHAGGIFLEQVSTTAVTATIDRSESASSVEEHILIAEQARRAQRDRQRDSRNTVLQAGANHEVRLSQSSSSDRVFVIQQGNGHRAIIQQSR